LEAIRLQGLKAEVEKVVEAPANKDNMKVIGGSSLSPPDVNESTAYQVNREDWVSAAPAEPDKGFCDVGFRLAFTAPDQPLKDLVDPLLAGLPYLPPAK